MVISDSKSPHPFVTSILPLIQGRVYKNQNPVLLLQISTDLRTK